MKTPEIVKLENSTVNCNRAARDKRIAELQANCILDDLEREGKLAGCPCGDPECPYPGDCDAMARD